MPDGGKLAIKTKNLDQAIEVKIKGHGPGNQKRTSSKDF